MSGFAFEPAAAVSVGIQGETSRFPVRRVYCVGRNYAEHAREMGFSERDPPFFFCKPADAIVPVEEGRVGEVHYPPATDDYQHEIELVVAIGRGGSGIAPAAALDHVYGYAVGLDMTRRDRQVEMRKQSRPWEIGKSFDASGPMGSIVPAHAIGHPGSGRIWLDVAGTKRQESDIGLLIWSVADVIAQLSNWFALAPGDLIFTGTPAGVGPVLPGQLMAGGIEGIGTLDVRVRPAS